MANVKVKITADGIFELKPENFQLAWEAHCYDEGDMEEGDEYPPITEEFMIERFTEDLENGDSDLNEVVDSVEVTRM